VSPDDEARFPRSLFVILLIFCVFLNEEIEFVWSQGEFDQGEEARADEVCPLRD
jgi:hypothetical protein